MWSSPEVPEHDPAVDVLIERFVERSRAYRRTGGMVGLCVMVAVAIVTDGGHGVVFGFPGVLAYALAGSLVGSLAAEAFRFRRSPSLHTASLSVRRADGYRDSVGDHRLWFVWACTAIGCVWGAKLGDTRTTVLGGLVVILAVVRWWATRRIVARPRPAVPPALADADDRIRRVAIADGIGRPVAALSALAASAIWGTLASLTDLSRDSTEYNMLWIAWWMSVVLSLSAVVWWWHTRHVGRDL
jgi:hypothetical protein